MSTTDQDMISLNGISLNGISLNGISLNGTSITGQSITGVNVTGASASGSTLIARSTTAAPWSGSSLVGSTWTATTSGNQTLKLRVDAAAQGTVPNAELWFYNVSYQTSSGWSPVCGVDASNKPVQAVAVAGVWGPVAADATAYTASTAQFTLACRAKTIAKCVELGYKTYKSLAPQLQACVRMLRADYCGNGTTYTVDGTTLNLYDNAGVQADTEAWLPEAEWNAAGAVCVNNKNNPRWRLVTDKDPSCAAAIMSSTCGTKFSVGTLLIDELPAGEVP
ncbi:MAG TPA: ADYC domain-containing protein [Kofleriaceae bacterium]|nr:ADYC domain-containing protein [Kofleriaceae bacterium]